MVVQAALRAPATRRYWGSGVSPVTVSRTHTHRTQTQQGATARHPQTVDNYVDRGANRARQGLGEEAR